MTTASDIGPYCVTPLWLVEACLDEPRALLVWAYLAAKHADRDTNVCWPSRQTIATALGCSTKTVDRALEHLRTVGGLESQHRHTPTGDMTSNLYRLRIAMPSHLVTPWTPVSLPLDTGVPTPLDTGVPQTSNQVEPVISEQENPFTSASRGTAADSELDQPAPSQPENEAQEEPKAAIARKVFTTWIEATGRNPKTTKLNDKRRSKIYARLREGYSEDSLCAAVQGVTLSRFHMGENSESKRYDDIVTVLRDGAQVEKFEKLWLDGGDAPRSAVDRAIAAIAAASGAPQ